MAQLTIYVPDDVAQRLKREAHRAGKSLSQYLVDLATKPSRGDRWPRDFADLYGSCAGELPDIEDAPPEPLEDL